MFFSQRISHQLSLESNLFAASQISLRFLDGAAASSSCATCTRFASGRAVSVSMYLMVARLDACCSVNHATVGAGASGSTADGSFVV